MNFDEIVSKLDHALLPRLEERAKSLRRRTSQYSEIRVGSIRHAEIFHAIGIACVPIWSSDASEYLSMCAKIAKHDSIIVRIDVSWGQGFHSGTSRGYVKKEDRGSVGRISTEEDIESVLMDWCRLERRFDRVALRGTPSSRFVRFLRGAPWDFRNQTKNA